MHKQARLALIILTSINLLNYVDRWLMAAIMPAMGSELHLSNTACGVIMSAFMVGYFLTSPLFGYLADRMSRLHLMSAGTFIWSLATGLGGLCVGAWQIFLARVVVGVGEASTVSTSQALLSDYFPPEKRNKIFGIFLAAVPVGAALGFILGGQLTVHLGWRKAFFVAGIPGLIMAFAVYFLKEPVRGQFDYVMASASQESPLTHVGGHPSHLSGFIKGIKVLLKNKNYMKTVWGYTAFTFTLGGLGSWVPLYMVKVRNTPLAEADSFFGVITVVTGVTGSLFGGWMATHFLNRRKRGDMLFTVWLTALATPLTFLCFAIQNKWGFYIFIALAEFLLFATQPTVNVIFMETVSPAIRSTALAFSVFMIHLFGDLISPPMVGILADWFDLQKGIFILPVALIPATFFYWRSYKSLSQNIPHSVSQLDSL